MDLDTYQAVRVMVRNRSLTTKEIAQKTGYSVGYVSELRRRAPSEDFKRRRINLSVHAEEMLAALEGLTKDPTNPEAMDRARGVLVAIKETV